MRTHHDAKAMAKTLRDELKHHNLDLSHGQCLDIVARQFGLKDWNVLAAKVGEPRIADSLVAGPDDLVIPDGWFKFGTAPHLYAMGVPKNGGPMTFMRTVGSPPDQGNIYGALAQAVSSEPYKGKHVCFSAEVKTEDVNGTAAIWLRIDDPSGRILSFSDLQRSRSNPPLSGTADWKRQTIALPVPAEAHSVNFGVYLHGFGKAFAQSFLLEISDGPNLGLDDLPIEPVNLELKVGKAA